MLESQSAYWDACYSLKIIKKSWFLTWSAFPNLLLLTTSAAFSVFNDSDLYSTFHLNALMPPKVDALKTQQILEERREKRVCESIEGGKKLTHSKEIRYYVLSRIRVVEILRNKNGVFFHFCVSEDVGEWLLSSISRNTYHTGPRITFWMFYPAEFITRDNKLKRKKVGPKALS